MSKEVVTQGQGITSYLTMSGEEIKLSPQIVKQYLVSGDADKVSDQEVMMFLALCKFQKLNPFLREAYLIKYGNSPATIVTGKETFLKRAVKNPNYRGHKTGASEESPPEMAWAEVYVEGYQVPIRCEVDYNEYVGRKSNGDVTKMWEQKPRTMLKKVALVQALREAFPEDFGGMYSPEEINTIKSDLPMDTIEVESTKSDTVQPGNTGANVSSSKPAEKASSSGIKPQEELKSLLLFYCHGDEDGALVLLKELSIFGKEGEEKYIDKLGSGTEKWAGKTLTKLKDKLRKEEAVPSDCTFNPEGCNNASMEDGIAYCGEMTCPFQAEKEF
ncbi:phage recombination protein Bet [Candidatus Pacearchaeota archaeon]|nr:phage recombination protein Bet [Candidatus Pacearchaeota archaeon]